MLCGFGLLFGLGFSLGLSFGCLHGEIFGLLLLLAGLYVLGYRYAVLVEGVAGYEYEYLTHHVGRCYYGSEYEQGHDGNLAVLTHGL